MAKIKGETIKLINLVESGVDNFNKPIYSEVEKEVHNVLIAPASSTEILDTLNLTGKKIVYNLAIPKGDNNLWESQIVEFFGERFRVVSIPQEGIEKLIPLKWNKKVSVERYDV